MGQKKDTIRRHHTRYRIVVDATAHTMSKDITP